MNLDFNELFGGGESFMACRLDVKDLKTKHAVVNIEAPFYWIPENCQGLCR